MHQPSSHLMQICNFWETAPRLLLSYFPSGRIKPQRAECDKQSQSFITELSAGLCLGKGRSGLQQVFLSPSCKHQHPPPEDLLAAGLSA